VLDFIWHLQHARGRKSVWREDLAAQAFNGGMPERVLSGWTGWSGDRGKPMSKRKFRGFTLIELMVVVSVIALLISIGLPSLAVARRSSKRTVCKKNLKSIGEAMHAYLLMRKKDDHLPFVETLPYYRKQKAQADNDREPYPAIYEVLDREIRSAVEVFECPADWVRPPDEDDAEAMQTAQLYPTYTDRYYDLHRTSYEWNELLNGARITLKSVVSTKKGLEEAIKLRHEEAWLLRDFDGPHQIAKETSGAFNYLYVDLHVAGDKEVKKKDDDEGTSPGAPSP